MNKKQKPFHPDTSFASGVLTMEMLRSTFEELNDPVKFKREKRKKDFYNQLFAEVEFEEKKDD